MNRTTCTDPVVAPPCTRHQPAQPASCARCRIRVATLRHARNTRRERAIRAGTWTFQAPAGPIRAHLLLLLATGMKIPRLAEVTGVSRSQLRRIRRGMTGTCRPTVAAAVLAVPVPVQPVPRTPAPPSGWGSVSVSAVPTHRRMRGLVVQGWSLTDQARLLSRSRPVVAGWNTYARVTPATAAAVAQLVDTIGTRPGPNRRDCAGKARARGWHPLSAWGARIDDPHAVPVAPGGGAADPPRPVLLTLEQQHRARQVLTTRHQLTGEQVAEVLRWLEEPAGPCRVVAETCLRDGVGLPPPPPVDAARVACAVAGIVAAGQLHPQERQAAVAQLVAAGFSDAEISAALRWHEDPVVGESAVRAYRWDHGIRAGDTTTVAMTS